MEVRTRVLVAAAAGLLAAVPAVVASRSARREQAPAGACPERIVSMAPHATAVLAAIGASGRIVGVDTFSSEPSVAGAPRLGSYVDPDLEGIIALRPDLVVVAPGHARLADDMLRFGIRVATAPDTRLEEVYESIARLGEATCRSAEAAALAGRLRADVASVSARARPGPMPRAVIVVDRTPDDLRQMFVAGRDNFLSDLLAAAGARNVFADVPIRFPQVSLEPILALDPDLIIELMPGATPQAAAERLDAWRHLVPDLRAVRLGRVRVLTDRSLPVPGPAIADGVRRLAEAVDAARDASEGVP